MHTAGSALLGPEQCARGDAPEPGWDGQREELAGVTGASLQEQRTSKGQISVIMQKTIYCLPSTLLMHSKPTVHEIIHYLIGASLVHKLFMHLEGNVVAVQCFTALLYLNSSNLSILFFSFLSPSLAQFKFQ